MEKMYSLAEAAKILGVKASTLRVWLKTGFVAGHRYGNKQKWYVSQSEIEKLQTKAGE